MVDKNSCIALYSTHDQAKKAVGMLQKAAFDLKEISMIGKGFHCEEHSFGFNNTDDSAKYRDSQGAVLYRIGIPEYSITRYEIALESNQYLVIVHGTQKEVERAHEVLVPNDPADVSIHLG